MKDKKAKKPQAKKSALRKNRALHIPLPFDKAVEGLLNVKPRNEDKPS